jgi:hypothetical protein
VTTAPKPRSAEEAGSTRSAEADTPTSYQGRHAWPSPWWLVVLALFLVLLGTRIALVRSGWLFGSGRILAVDATIGAILVIGIAVARRLSIRSQAAPAQAPLTDWLAIAAAVLGAPALVVSGANFFAPSTPSGLSPAACAGAPAYGWEYYGVTTGPIGNYARSGPGLAFPQTDRFDSGCTLGFAGYCLGDPVEEAYTKWLETRWLLVGRHTGEPGRTAASFLSGEIGEPRFVSHSYVAPKSPEGKLEYLGDNVCKAGRPRPGNVTMTAQSVTAEGVTFDLRVDNAERLGVAIALPREQLRRGSAVRRVYSAPTDSGGSAQVTWRAGLTVAQLNPTRVEPVDVAALAVACLGPVAPADSSTAATLGFQVAPDGSVRAGAAPSLDADLRDRLRRAACDSEPVPGGVPSATPSPGP